MLNSNSIKSLTPKAARYTVNDDRGLYLEIMPTGKKVWRFRYSFNNKQNRISLGPYPEISLSDARKKRDELRVQLANGIDPQEKRRQEKELSNEKYLFETIAREWHKKFKSRWTEDYAELTLTRLENNIFPYLGKTPISEITPLKLLEVLRLIEKRGALETAKRVRGICSMIFRYAIVCGLAERDSAQDLQGALTPSKNKHFASITDPKDVGQFLRDIAECKAHFTVYCALQLAPLVFVRPGELRHAEWEEIDFDEKIWRIPAHKMKMRSTHLVPLSKQAINILLELKPLSGEGKYLFPSIRSKTIPMSENTLTVALRRLGYSGQEMTVHGFRSMASTLLNELGWNRDAIERQLAHCERNSVRAAYNYAEFLPERKRMMQAWADYLEELKNNVK